MKLRHAAALALVGWYFVTPRVFPTDQRSYELSTHDYLIHGKFQVDSGAPLSQWQINMIYSRESDCEHYRTAQIERFQKHPRRGSQNAAGKARSEGLCIAADDPRLKGRVN